MITIAILTKNDEIQLEKLLPSLKWADRVLVIDDESADNTIAVAKKWGAKVWVRKLKDNFANQRNFALSKVVTEWVLFLDPDERLSKELVEEIREAIKSDKYDSYRIERQDVLWGKTLRFGETGQTKLVRLGKRRSGRWKRWVHEVWAVNKPGRLTYPILHKSHKTMGGMINKIQRYSGIEAKYRVHRGEDWSLVELVSFPVGKFLFSAVIKSGWLDGWQGLVMSAVMAYHSWLVRVKVIRIKLKKHIPEDFIGKLIWWWGSLCLLLVMWGQLSRVSIRDWGDVYIYEMIMFGVVLLGLVRALFIKRWVWPRKTKYWLIFVTILMISLGVNTHRLGGEIFSAGLYWVRYVGYGLFALVLFQLGNDGKSLIDIYRTLAYLGMGLALLGLIQYFLLPDTRFLFSYGWDEHYYRVIGTIFDPGFLGILLLLGLIVSFSQTSKRWWYGRLILIGSLLLTYSRSTYIVMILILWMAMIRKQKAVYGWLITILLILLIWWLPKPGGEGVNLARTYSVAERARSIVTGVEIAKQNPWWGIGFNAYKVYTNPNRVTDIPVHPSAPDNSLVLIMATAGVFGVLGWLVYVIMSWYPLRNLEIINLSLIAILAHGMSSNTFFYPPVMMWWNMLLIQGEWILDRRSIKSIDAGKKKTSGKT